MDLRSCSICFACALLIATSGVFGWKLVKKGNYLLGLEWWAVTFSASNFLIYLLTSSSINYEVAHFMDAFSRGFGVPIIAVGGLMVVTHGYRPTVAHDIVLFGMAILGTFVLVSADFVTEILPYFYVVMWTLLSLYLLLFIKRLVKQGEAFHAMTVTLALIASLGIAGIYDFYKIPGGDHNIIFNFFVLALTTWSYMIASLSYAYFALERGRA
ncbi:hypothetical protein [Trinickia dinghuensis]|uniref:Transporter n=1 Tax=Trinickia dinghuensis TaxID=2291023 RepID=A0A3D8JT02_9BURK|nr:hypothetical protein [Trinickia dinghuensis]RDU95892.1 hypothetical protein DWV00_26990 [Trinickia dinghuensis]